MRSIYTFTAQHLYFCWAAFSRPVRSIYLRRKIEVLKMDKDKTDMFIKPNRQTLVKRLNTEPVVNIASLKERLLSLSYRIKSHDGISSSEFEEANSLLSACNLALAQNKVGFFAGNPIEKKRNLEIIVGAKRAAENLRELCQLYVKHGGPVVLLTGARMRCRNASTPSQNGYTRGRILRPSAILRTTNKRIDKKSIVEALDRLTDAINNVSIRLERMEKCIAVIDANIELKKDRDSLIISLIREVNEEIIVKKRGKKDGSLPDAVKYIRFEVSNEDQQFYTRAIEARQNVRDWVREHQKKDENAHWNTLAKKAQSSYKTNAAAHKRALRSGRNAPPGPVPILDNGTGGGIY